MSNESTETRPACPIWCTISPEQHAKEAPSLEGGAVHWSRRLVGDGGTNDVRVAAVTDAAGEMNPQYPMIHMADAQLSRNQARALALDLLTAAALADTAMTS